MSTKQTITCPNCQGKIDISTSLEKGDVVTCPDCSVDLEITKVKPIQVQHAPKTQEDWGQ